MKSELLIITALESELKQADLPSDVKIVFTGIGKVNAALESAKAIQAYQPKLIINFGTVGKITAGLNGLLSIRKVIQRDMVAEPLAPRGMTPFCPHPYEYSRLVAIMFVVRAIVLLRRMIRGCIVNKLMLWTWSCMPLQQQPSILIFLGAPLNILAMMLMKILVMSGQRRCITAMIYI